MSETTNTATENKPATLSLYAALAAAQSEFPVIGKNAVNPIFKNRYADLSSILAAVKPALNRHGLFLFQKVMSEGTDVIVETIIVDAKGDSISSGALRMPCEAKYDKKGNRIINAQSFGSTETYARRYSLQAILGVAADDDDDGSRSGNALQEEGQQGGDAQPQAAQQGFVLTQEIVDVGHKAAADGVDAYKSWFFAQPPESQKALRESGWHNALWQEAKAADAKGADAQTAANEANKQ